MKLTDLLRKAIKDSGLSQVELARRSGVNRASINCLVNKSRAGLDVDSVDRLCKALGVEFVVLKIKPSKPLER